MACESSHSGDREFVGKSYSPCVGIPHPWAGALVADHRAGTQSHLSLPKHKSIPNSSTLASYRKAKLITKSMVIPAGLERLVVNFGIPLVVETRRGET